MGQHTLNKINNKTKKKKSLNTHVLLLRINNILKCKKPS